MNDNINLNVSVVMAVRNEKTYIESAVKSIVEQEGMSFELIVVDDNSTDETYSIVSRLCSVYPQIRLVRNANCGKCSAFNYGVSLAKGRFVCIFAGDDIMPAGSLVARWKLVKDFSDDIPVVGLCKLVTMSEIKRFDGHLVPKRPGRGGFTGVSYLMNRATLKKIFPVPESLPNEDTWMELVISHFPNWHLIHSDIVGCAWRVHQGNSINMLVNFDDYNKKLTPRMQAIPLFYEKHGVELNEQDQRLLRGKIACEKSRIKGSILGILFSEVNFVDKLRAISTANRGFYNMRKVLFGLLSGW